MKIKLLFLLSLTVLVQQSYPQQNQFITYEDNKFKKGCEDFYPMVMNYPVCMIKKFHSNLYYVASDPSACEQTDGAGFDNSTCGSTQVIRQQKVVADINKIFFR
jgi:hypothetical protein